MSAHILLIEDEAPLRTSIAAILRRKGFIVIEASNGSEILTWPGFSS